VFAGFIEIHTAATINRRHFSLDPDVFDGIEDEFQRALIFNAFFSGLFHYFEISEKDMSDFVIEKAADHFNQNRRQVVRQGWQNDYFAIGVTFCAAEKYLDPIIAGKGSRNIFNN